MESADVHRSQTRDSDKSESDVCINLCVLVVEAGPAEEFNS